MTDPIDPFTTLEEKDYHSELVGAGKKYADDKALAKAVAFGQEHINRLEVENQALKAQAANGKSVADLLEEIRKLKEPQEPSNPPPANPEAHQPPQDIENLVLTTLEKSRQEEALKANKTAVISKMQEVWGADAGKELQKVAKDLGVSVEYLNGVAQQSPSAFFQLTGLNQNRATPSGTTVPTSTVSFGVSVKGKRDAAFYRELKKTNPALYKESKTRIQMERDALEQGEAFFN